MSEDIRKFATALNTLARLCNYELHVDVLNLFHTMLKGYGIERVVDAINLYAAGLVPNASNSFPSPLILRKIITGEPLPGEERNLEEIEAREAASNIITACSKFGEINGLEENAWQKLKDLEAFVGPIAWDLISRRNGWNEVNRSITNANMNSVEVQFRELAKGAIERRRRGELLALPAKPKPPPLIEPSKGISPLSKDDVYPPHLRRLLNFKNEEKNHD